MLHKSVNHSIEQGIIHNLCIYQMCLFNIYVLITCFSAAEYFMFTEDDHFALDTLIMSNQGHQKPKPLTVTKASCMKKPIFRLSLKAKKAAPITNFQFSKNKTIVYYCEKDMIIIMVKMSNLDFLQKKP